MTFVALAICFLMAALGAFGVFSPSGLLDVVRRFQTPTGLYVASASRLVFGAALLVSAPDSRAPQALNALGVLIVVAGLITPFFGVERFRKMLDWWSSLGAGFLRAWGFSALVFGLALAYAVVP